MHGRFTINIPFPYSKKEIRLKIEIDSKKLEPCVRKIEDVWSWKKMKTEKWILHVDEQGKLEIEAKLG